MLALTLGVRRVEPARHVDVDVDGDLRGSAALDLSDVDGRAGSSRARLHWTVVLHHRMLEFAAYPLRPVLQWGHDWVVATGVEEFRSRALSPLPIEGDGI